MPENKDQHMAHSRLIMEIVVHWIDTQSDPDFCIVARVEAFIAGWGLDEALKRSEAYLNAGADAILMHSKKADPSDIESFVKAWNNQVSIVLFSWNKVGLKKKKADSGLLIMASSCSPMTELERAQQQQQSQAVESTQILIYV